MSSSNPPEPDLELQTQPDVDVAEDSNPDTQPTAAAEEPRKSKICRFYQSPKGCFKGDRCPNSHSLPATNHNGQAEGGTEVEPSSQAPKKKRKPFVRGKGRGAGKLSPEQVKEQAAAQSAKAKAENAKKVTIFAEDEENSWTLERDFLSAHSKTLAHVLSFSPRNADAGAKDPIKYIRGLIRFGDQSESLQLDDVKSDDFDTFLAAVRAKDNTQQDFNELRAILTLSTDWGFDELRARTILDIEKLHPGPVDRTVLARRCKITKWIRGALLSLTLLPDPLNATEIQLLGTTTAALIWRAREEIFIHRLQNLSAKDQSAPQVKCTGTGCKKAIREALLRLLEQPTVNGKSEQDLAGLLEAEVKADEKTKDSLCEGCKSDEGMKTEVNNLVGEFKLARVIMEVQLGKEGVKWLEPVV